MAELEAVVGMTEEDEPVEKREAEEPSNFLAMYFRDMARLAVLRPQEEFEIGTQASRRSRSRCGSASSSFPPVVDHVLLVCERTLENSIARVQERSRKRWRPAKSPTRGEQERFGRSVVKMSERLRAVDIDKRNLDWCWPSSRRSIAGSRAGHLRRARVLAQVAGLQELPGEVATAYNRRMRPRTSS